MLKNKSEILQNFRKLLNEYKENPYTFKRYSTNINTPLKEDYETIGSNFKIKVKKIARRQ